MPASQNGYSALDLSVTRTALVDGSDVRVRVRTGPAGDLLLHVAARWHREVEALRAPDGILDCWGYAPRPIRGNPTTLSNHASGTALDLRARLHPLGQRGTYTPAQVTAIHRIIADCRGAVRWGGDYTGRTDEMHVEILAGEDRCRDVLTKLTATTPSENVTSEEDPMPTTDDIAAAVWRYGIRNGFGDTVQAQQILAAGEKRAADAQLSLAGLTTQIAQLRAAGIDEATITRAVTAALAARV